MSSDSGVTTEEAIEALLLNEHTFTLADTLDAHRQPQNGGRPREYPTFIFVVADALANADFAYNSVAHAFRNLGGEVWWPFMRRILREAYPDQPERHLPEKCPNRTLIYKRVTAGILDRIEELREVFKETAALTAEEMGLADPDGPGSVTSPVRSRAIVADGKAITTIYPKVRPGEIRTVEIVDPSTGEITTEQRPRRYDPTAKDYSTGDRRNIHGSKFWQPSIRHDFPHERVILDVAHCPSDSGQFNSENHVAHDNLIDLSRRLPGVIHLVVDGVLTGDEEKADIQRKTGKILVSPVPAAKKDKKTGARLKEKVQKHPPLVYEHPDGREETIVLTSVRGWPCREVITAEGDTVYERLRHMGAPPRPNKDGTFRPYVIYEYPSELTGEPIQLWLRTDTTEKDKKASERGKDFNRSEHVRQLPPGHPAYETLIGFRQDSESINRGIEDGLYRQRARSIGYPRQQFNLITRAHLVNSIARRRNRRRRNEPEPLDQAA